MNRGAGSAKPSAPFGLSKVPLTTMRPCHEAAAKDRLIRVRWFRHYLAVARTGGGLAAGMWGLRRYLVGTIAVGALALAIGGCSSDIVSNISNVNLLPRADQLARPDWLTYSGGKEDFTLRPVGPDDLVSQDGQCAITAQDAAAASAVAARNNPDAAAGAPREPSPEAPPEMPLQSGGIALQMTECEVVRRAGAPERLDFGGSQQGERTVTITYIRGSRPGIYRFSGGRLSSIERAPEPPPTAKSKAKPAKKKERS